MRVVIDPNVALDDVDALVSGDLDLTDLVDPPVRILTAPLDELTTPST